LAVDAQLDGVRPREGRGMGGPPGVRGGRAGRFWPAATVAAAARSWIEPPRVESLVCACRLFMVSSVFRCSRFGSAPLNRVALLAGLSLGGGGRCGFRRARTGGCG